jgi:hypothetical protein
VNQQDLLFGATTLILVGTLTVWIIAWVRGRGRDRD